MHNPVDKTNPTTQSCGDTLRRLPAALPPPYHWQEFRRRAQVRSAETSRVRWRHVAAAAGLLLVICGIAFWGRFGDAGYHLMVNSRSDMDDSSSQTPGLRGVPDDIDALRDLQGGWGDVSGDAAVAVSHSRAIESWLATLPREPVVVRVGTRADIAKLEDRIAQVDDLLTSVRLDGRQPDRLVALQRERVRLVGSLAQVRYAEVLASESP